MQVIRLPHIIALFGLLLGLGGYGCSGGGDRVSPFIEPLGIALDSAGRIYVADNGNYRIVRMDDMTGAGWTTFGTRGSGPGQFENLFGIAVDATGRIYGVDAQVVRVDDISGAGWTTFGTQGMGVNQFHGPDGVAVDAAGRVYVADLGNGSFPRIVRIDDMSGAGWAAFGTVGSGADQFSNPIGVDVDTLGRIYVVDSGNNRIVRVDDMSGTGWIAFGTNGRGKNQFSGAVGIAVDAAGRIYVADAGNSRIVRIDDMTGAGWTTLETLDAPLDVTLDTAGRIYVSDRGGILRVNNMSGAGRVVYP